MILTNILFFVVFFILEVGYIKIAQKFKVFDIPNDRSSHQYIPVRGGGVIFAFAILLGIYLYDSTNIWLISSISIFTIVSFIDDLKQLSIIKRLVMYSVSIFLIVIPYSSNNIFFILSLYLFILAFVNIYNFMDGINGLNFLYSFIVLGSLSFINTSAKFVSPNFINIIIISLLVFGVFNFRKKAICFSGDVGSIVLSAIISYFLLLICLKLETVIFILFIAVYLIDGGLTIIIRLINGENIFKAHRTHLYQYLANEYGLPHTFVSFVYSLLQLLINIITIYAFNRANNLIFLLLSMSFLLILYSSIRVYLIKRLTVK